MYDNTNAQKKVEQLHQEYINISNRKKKLFAFSVILILSVIALTWIVLQQSKPTNSDTYSINPENIKIFPEEQPTIIRGNDIKFNKPEDFIGVTPYPISGPTNITNPYDDITLSQPN